jgi:ribose 5-phosphate isomerase B
MTLALGADHRGFACKEFIKSQQSLGSFVLQWLDTGTFSQERTDYPIYAHMVVSAIITGKAHLGILLCGSGAGMAIAANRTPGIYAAVAWNVDVARAMRADDHVNVLVLPTDYISQEQAVAIVTAWLTTPCKPGRYSDRLAMIDAK